MAERAAVTGATGFIGTALCRQLRAAGWSVTALRRPSSDASRLADLDVEWVVGDVLDPASVRELADGADVVFHLAGLGLLDADPQTVWRVNVEGTRRAVEAALDADARLVFAGTAGTRRSATVADETDLAPAVGAYQGSKAAGERLLAAARSRGLDAVTVLPTSVFGPGDPRFTTRLVTLATSPLGFVCLPGGVSVVDVRDVARGIVAAAERGERGEAYLLGGENLAYGEILSTIAREAGGDRFRVQLPPALLHLAGRVVGPVNATLGTRLFPVDRAMSRLVTRELYYSSAKARSALGYTFAPFAEVAGAGLRWCRDGDRPADVATWAPGTAVESG